MSRDTTYPLNLGNWQVVQKLRVVAAAVVINITSTVYLKHCFVYYILQYLKQRI